MIILLTGTNDFLLKQTLDNLATDFVCQFGTHAVERLDGADIETAKLGELLQGASLFAAERLVIIREASANKLLWEALEGWLGRVPAEVTLALVEPSVDKRTKTYKELVKLGEVTEFGELSEPELSKWLQESAAEQGGKLDAATAIYLLKKVGSDQWRLWQEMQKLLNYDPAITKKSIDELVDATLQGTAFELLDAAMNHKTELIARLLESVAADEDPYKFMGLLVSQIHALAVAKTGAGKSVDEMAKDSGLHPFVLRKTAALVRGISMEDLQKLIDAVALCDEQLKSTGADPWFLVGQCLRKIARL